MTENSLQDIALRLTRFWVDEGCRWLPAADLPLSAAVHHPQAFFGLLDTEPVRWVGLQPVRRPRDGRHGEQPYRLAGHLQLEVLYQPAPDDLLALVLRSLRAIGFQIDLHDLRFAEGRWRSETIDAWGAGWNLRVDGLGVARITLLQAVAGAPLEPVCAEVTYGVERLATCVTGAASAYDLAWSSGGPSYRAVRAADEEEASRWAFELADVERLRRRLADGEAEARACLDQGLGRLAYEAAMAVDADLEVLAARAGLEVGEREATLSRIRELVRAAADLATGRERSDD